jgi:2-hydroxy-3-keto-5-methylthiopentenyl-1-phosphate phosphatase
LLRRWPRTLFPLPLADGEPLRVGSGVCKCRVVKSPDLQIYIGDGRSDFCVADRVDLVFAKAKLIDCCEDRGIPYVGFEKFTALLPKMKAVLPSVARGQRAPLHSMTA